MLWDTKYGTEIYEELRRVSAKILPKIGCHTEPHEVDGKGKTRTCKWDPIGKTTVSRYRGILFHYTAGVSGVGSMRWCNHPGWGNEGSSWHVTIFDRITDNIVGDEWLKIDNEIRRLFPVPTIIMADFRWGTWHGNWTCKAILGVENRNGGYHGYKKAKNGLKGLGKKGVEINGRIWEEYTREQMIANVNVGRMANAWIDNQMDPDWVLTHQCIWATKMDCGLAYPIHDVRRAIFSNKDTTLLSWLGFHPMAPDTNEDDDAHWESLSGLRMESEEDFVKWVEPSEEIKLEERDPIWVAAQLYRLGFNTGPELPDTDILRKQVRWFQRSTCAYKDDYPHLVLKPDGITGPLTEKEIIRRLKKFNIVT